MKSLQEFLSNFFKNQGQYVFVSLLIAKICGFGSSLFIIRLLPEQEFGTLSIVISVFTIFAAFSGMGSQQSLLRFGSMEQDFSQKQILANYFFKTGFYYQIILTILFLAASIFFLNNYEDIFLIFVFFAIRLLGFYFLNHIQSEFRINSKNRQFARVNNIINIFGLILMVVLTYFFSLKGYLFSVALTPLLSLFWYRRRENQLRDFSNVFNKKEMWFYGFYSSGAALMSDALFSIDVLLLGFLLNVNAVANYKVAILLPANITFLAITFMQSDFPLLAKNHKNPFFLKNYIQNYYKIFVPVCTLIFVIAFVFKHVIFQTFFGLKYADNTKLFMLFIFVFCCNMLFRNLYGNLLSAVGKMKVNTLVSFLALILVGALALILVPKFGIFGMALSMAFTLLFTGFALMFFFYKYFKKLDKSVLD